MRNLIQKIAMGIVLATAGITALVTGCATGVYEYKNSQGCWRDDLNKGEVYYSQNCDGNWKDMGSRGNWEVDKNGNFKKVDLSEPLRIITGGLLGVASSGALDSTNRTLQQNLAVRGTASGLQQYQMNDAIRNSGNNENSNNQKNTNINRWIRPDDSFICRDFKDFNGDGYIGKDELIGVGNYFKCEEEYTKDNPMKIIIGSVWEGVKGQKVLINIRRNGEIRYTGEKIILNNGTMQREGIDFYNGEKDSGIEEWKADFYLNGKLDASKSISFFIDYGQKKTPIIPFIAEKPATKDKQLKEEYKIGDSLDPVMK